ncbi:MAG TPA: hypothetical protein VF506_11235 [Streptosporangiaceae bacterium]
MALVFAVFLLALLVVFVRPEGRAQRIARVTDVLTRAARVIKSARRTGTETVERIAAELAEEHRSRGGVGPLLNPADGGGAEPRQQRAES